jgi:hypothetical protein
MTRPFAIVAAFLLVAVPVLTADTARSLQASLSTEGLSITAATPGGQVVLFGIAVRTERGMLTRRRAAEVVSDPDSDGMIQYHPRGGVPFRSVWVAVDLTNGSSAVASLRGFTVNHHEIELKSLKKGDDGLASALELERLSVELLLVRPGEGVWILRAREGSGGDGDGIRDDKLTLVFEQAEPLGDGKGKAPKKLKAGDVLVALDPGRLDLRTLTVAK